jgi:APA family basic amino acid/polyamine antiporter
MRMSNLFQKKPFELLLVETEEHGKHTLKRSLGPVSLTFLGIGAIVGAGIFVITGQAAANHAGPAVVVSFVLAGLAAAFAGLCYAEFASMIPIAGSAYTYSYAVFGEVFAWIIGWDLVLEYAFGAATVASGWAGYFVSFLQDRGIRIPPEFIGSFGQRFAFYDGRWTDVRVLPMNVDLVALPQRSSLFNLVAFAVVLVITTVLVVGIRQSANLNSAFVLLKLSVVILFIVVAGAFVVRHPEIARTNWHPFIPANSGKYGHFGVSGIATGAAIVFFAFLGFDAVSTTAQEAKNPQRDIPIAMLVSLGFCTVLYILVSGLLTGVVSYRRLVVPDPVALGIDATGLHWGSVIVKIGAILGLGTVMIVQLLAQSRIFYSMSRDGLLWEAASAIHPRFRTPWISNITTGSFVALFSAFIPMSDLSNLVSIGTLLAFLMVCGSVLVLRLRHPELKRGFRVPMVPLIPALGMAVSILLMASLPSFTWYRLVGWQLFGALIYVFYGRKKSRIQKSIGDINNFA